MKDEEILKWDDLPFFKSIYDDAGFSEVPRPEFYEINSPFGMMTQKTPSKSSKRLSPHDFINTECDYLSKVCSEHLNLTVAFNPAANLTATNLYLNEPIFPTYNLASTSLGYCSLEDGNVINSHQDEPKLYENTSNKVLKAYLTNRTFYIPPRSRFVISDISICHHLIYRGESFDCIVMDPAWPNKAVRRQKTYAAVTFDLINSIPIDGLLSDDGIVMVWVTNSPTVRSWTQEFLQNWGLTECGEIFWVKTTKAGAPVYSFNRTHKMPYEKVILASREHCREKYSNLVTTKVIMSIPNASASRKPPISHILKDKIGWAKGLELFGRYLLPEMLTIGDQAIKFQEQCYFFNKKASE
uniref:DNA N6-methyl methyltransferase n=1 Tax=Bursaphelenchus xylophilus TaxID=6326 RepID=A0A1I7SVQ2_BURXY|nr:DNA N6-methyl methyltransferase [Bursaphelenchus xylophilus]